MKRTVGRFIWMLSIIHLTIAQGQQSGFPSPHSQFGQQQQAPSGQQQGSFVPNQLQNQPSQFGQQQQGFGQQQQTSSGQFFGGAGQQQQPNQFGGGQLPQQQGNINPMVQQPGLIGSQSQPSPFGGVASAVGSPMLKITADSVPLEKATHLNPVIWHEPYSSQVYCISQPPTQQLFFSCASCNSSLTTHDQVLASNTQQFSDSAGFPAIKLMPMPIQGETWDKVILQCTAFYQDASGNRQNVTTSSTVAVAFVGKPVVYDTRGHKPLTNADGTYPRFYFPQNAGGSLVCLAKGNPPPSQYEWRMGGQLIGQGQQVQIPANVVGTSRSLSCRASNAQQGVPGQWQTSDDVFIENLVGPAPQESNFDVVAKSADLKDATTGKVPLGKTLTLQCTAASSSRPFVMWLQQTAPGKIFNASCDGSGRVTQERQEQNIFFVTSQCSLRFDTYEKAGDYWCSACSYIADNDTLCYPAITTVPGPPKSISFDVGGVPLISPYYKVERLPNSDKLTVYFTYCADPPPNQNDVYFMMDQQKLTLNNRLGGNIFAGAAQQNQTFSRCYDIPLVFETAAAVSTFRTVQLNIANPSGQMTQQSFSVQDLARNPGHNDAMAALPYDPTGIAVGISVALILLIIIILVACLWYKQKLCFAPKKSNAKTTKIGGSKPAGKYQAKPEVPHEKVTPLTRPAPTNGYSPERNTGHNNGYSPNSRRPHEGMTYSEFDLVKDSTRLASAAPRQVEYARMQPVSAQLKSPTNSTV